MDGWGVRSAGKARCVRQQERAAETCGFGAGRSVRAGAGQAARGRDAERLRQGTDCFCKILRAGGWKGRFIFNSLLKFYLVKKRGTMI